MASARRVSPDRHDEQDFSHWNRIYLAVIIYTAITIAALWEFSAFFTR